MNDIKHPKELLQPRWVQIIRDNSAAAEQQGLLQPEQLELIYRQQWFKLLVPKIYGGLEMPLNELIRLEEALSWADGSLGWVITLCTGAGWFGGFIEPKVAEVIFADPKACLAGSGAATGIANKTSNGYVINGSWKYASGVKHATQLTANCAIYEYGKAVLIADGKPLVLPFVIDGNKATMIPAWQYVGMMGTGSHAFAMDDVVVPADRCFKINGEAKVVDAPLYYYPFHQLAEGTLAANLSGMALHFIDLCKPLFLEKQKSDKLSAANRATMTGALKNANMKMQSARNAFYEAVDKSWENLIAGKENAGALNAVSATSRQLAAVARHSVDGLFPYCGLMAAAPDTEMNRVWRDFHTAGQHSLLTFPE